MFTCAGGMVEIWSVLITQYTGDPGQVCFAASSDWSLSKPLLPATGRGQMLVTSDEPLFG